MNIINWIELGAALSLAFWLIKIGYDGDYFDEFLISIIIQIAFTGLMWLGLRKTFLNFKYLVFVLAGLSFIFPIIGAVRQRRPFKKAEKEKKDLKTSIRNGQKFKSFSSFVRSNKDSIGAVSYSGRVYYSDEYPIFVDQDTQDEVRKTWNPKLGYPDRYAAKNWKTKEFFTVSEGERSWTYEEKDLLKELIKETLDSIGTWYPDSDDSLFRRHFPESVKKKNLRNPY